MNSERKLSPELERYAAADALVAVSDDLYNAIAILRVLYVALKSPALDFAEDGEHCAYVLQMMTDKIDRSHCDVADEIHQIRGVQ